MQNPLPYKPDKERFRPGMSEKEWRVEMKQYIYDNAKQLGKDYYDIGKAALYDGPKYLIKHGSRHLQKSGNDMLNSFNKTMKRKNNEVVVPPTSDVEMVKEPINEIQVTEGEKQKGGRRRKRNKSRRRRKKSRK